MKFVIVASSWLFILLYQWRTVTQISNSVYILLKVFDWLHF